MEELYLKEIEEIDETNVLDLIKEFVMNGSKRDGMWYEDSTSFEEMLANLQRHKNTKFENYEQKVTPCIQYLLYRKEDNKLIGMVSIRPFLTRRIDEDFGGNIGYGIRPSERRKGYAKIGCALAIKEVKKINAKDDIYCGCYKDNIGSRKTIVYNGGILVKETTGIIPQQYYVIHR